MNQVIISLEGIDGAGKTTLINKLKEIYGDKCLFYSRTQKGDFAAKMISLKFIRTNHFLQIPIYLALAHLNHRNIKKEKKKDKSTIIMDRCFLSNLCYFFPRQQNNTILLKFLLLFEPKIYPQKIFIIDVNPVIAQKRDKYQKDLLWLEKTRTAYLTYAKADCLKKYDIEIIEDHYTIEEKVKIITNYLDFAGTARETGSVVPGTRLIH